MHPALDLDLAVDHRDLRPGRRRRWLTVVFTALWAVAGIVAVPVLAFGLEKSLAIFGGPFRSSELYVWALTIGTGLLYASVLIGLSLALVFRKWLSAAFFGIVLAGAIATYSAIYGAHPEWFHEVVRVVVS